MERLDSLPQTSRTAPAFNNPLLACALLALGACNASPRGTQTGAKAEATAEHATAAEQVTAVPAAASSDATSRAATASKVGRYGAPLGSAPAYGIATVLQAPERFTGGEPVQVEGHVRRACTAMGCWMELAESGAADTPGCRVMMKDHAFFVPTDSAGADAKVEGTVAVRHIDPAQVAHMESEGAAFPNKAADGSAEEVRFIATGVELRRGS